MRQIFCKNLYYSKLTCQFFFFQFLLPYLNVMLQSKLFSSKLLYRLFNCCAILKVLKLFSINFFTCKLIVLISSFDILVQSIRLFRISVSSVPVLMASPCSNISGKLQPSEITGIAPLQAASKMLIGKPSAFDGRI